MHRQFNFHVEVNDVSSMLQCCHPLSPLCAYAVFTVIGFFGIFVDVKYCESKCTDQPDGIHHTYQIEEETPVPIHIGDLTADICFDNVNGTESFPSTMRRFIIFPSTQPYFSYFEIRQAKFRSNLDGTQRTIFKQYLILVRSIDREVMCDHSIVDWTSSTEGPNSALLSYRNSHCLCESSSGLCTIHLHLLLQLAPVVDSNTNPQIRPYTLSDNNEFITVQLNIIDINDNTPSFQPSEYTLFVSESEGPGSKFRLPSAVDRDLGRNARVSYDLFYLNHSISQHSKNLSIPSLLESIDILDNGQPTFLLEMMDYSDELFLKLQSKLDREMRSSYQIMITATDQAPVRQKTGHLLLHVIVEDVNDSPPKFEKSIYVFHVHESTSPGSKVGGVHADDEDSGANGEVTYRLLQSFFNGSCRHTWKNRFRIDAGTGVIRVHSPLDREQDLKLVFQVEAVDHGQPERSATTKVIIFLLDDNDNSPSIRVWGKHVLTNPNGLVGCSDPDACSLLTAGVQMQLTIWVTEWLKPGSVVAFLESWDLDELERGNVSCSVNNGEYLLQHVQELLMGNSVLVRQSASNKSGDPCAILSSKQSSKFYQLVNSRIMDWEMKPHIYIPIVCHDADKVLPRSSTLLLQISVKDENDNAPIFNLPVIVSPAIWINKHDWLPNVPEEKRGPLKSLTPFQKEIKIVVPETLPPNTTLAYFSGYDADDSQNSELLFQISLDERSGFAPPSTDVHHLLTPGKGFLSISGITGSLLITSSLLSAPAHQWHNFKVILSDKGEPALTTSLPISVWIQTVNQHPPEILIDVEFHSGIQHPENRTSSSNIIKIMENEPPGTAVCRLKVIDFDRQEAGRVSFWLAGVYKVEHNATTAIHESPFLLNNRTGLVTTTRFLDREGDGDEIILHIYAQDYGTPMKTTLKNISVRILDMNDHTPIFLMPLKPCFNGLVTADPESNNQLFILNGNFTYEHTVPHFLSGDSASIPGVLFRARDADIGQNGAVSYSIIPSCLSSTDVSRAKQFLTLNNRSGCLVPNKQLIDQDLPTVFHFRLMAHDSDVGRHLWSALELVVSARLTNNTSLTLEISGYPGSVHCEIQPQGQYGQENRVQTIHELTPLMRALLSVTVMAGAMVVTVVIFVLVKRPGWIIGRNYLFEASQKVKIDIFQCRTVHNEIDAWPPNFLPLDQQVRTNGGDDKCVIQLETKSPGSITNAMQFQINPQENSGTVMDSERLDQRKRCQSVEVITYPVHIHREPSPITSRVVYQQDFLKKTADDPTFLKCPVYLDPFDERLVQLISHKDYDKCVSSTVSNDTSPIVSSNQYIK
ncbi:hypothetical protein T265_02215 [Opisthorchis viverrini]|uniref:Cadherin domain-containing protein n=1 Tax=Opisthorchis viverrini TaxID=6198 RepID=A0A074ZZY0_OPIVI|nr:hypothetical protein T265_02215 [Opisthorchis viverrini]KER31572.1 hypothetical protein T265_02215 [Opisthorchis viverrini]